MRTIRIENVNNTYVKVRYESKWEEYNVYVYEYHGHDNKKKISTYYTDDKEDALATYRRILDDIRKAQEKDQSVIAVVRHDEGYYVDYTNSKQNDNIYKLFGSVVLPTAFTCAAPVTDVIECVQKGHPGEKVIFIEN